MQPMDSGLIGNSRTSAIIDSHGRFLWWCYPVFDSKPLCSDFSQPCCHTQQSSGTIDVLFEKVRNKDQYYVPNTPVLITRFADNAHNVIETVDFAPCYIQYGRLFTPSQIIRIIRRVAGKPRISIRISPSSTCGTQESYVNVGANHITFKGNHENFRVTSDASIMSLLDSQAFYLEDSVTLVMGIDEPLGTAPKEYGRASYEATVAYWQGWIHNISIPLEWQNEVIRSAITLRLNTFRDTGAIVSGHCAFDTFSQNAFSPSALSWVQDANSVIRALNRLGATGTMERYLQYLMNVIADANGLPFQAVYDIRRNTIVATQDSGIWETGEHNDSYGAAILACTQAFFDARLYHPADKSVFRQLERLGEIAVEKYRRPDLDIWGHGETAVHTYSSMMCWAACDRLALIADKLSLHTEAKEWRDRATMIHERIIENAWHEGLQTFTATWQGNTVDAGLLRMTDLHFLPNDDSRVIKTVEYISEKLLNGDFLECTETSTDQRNTSFHLICTFWWIQALHAIGQNERARDAFERILFYRNHLGMLSSDVSQDDRSLSGIFPSTASMVGIIQCAVALSDSWDHLC